MLSLAALTEIAERAPAFPEIKRRFNTSQTYYGLNMFAPVLGNPRVSVMRQLHDLWRVLRLVEAREAHMGRRFSRLVHSRLEFHWLMPHPPLQLLDPAHVWVPSGQNIAGVNDRHAVVPRENATVYFGRWQLLLSEKLFSAVPLSAMLHASAEDFLDGVLRHARVRVAEFPNVAVLACCERGHRCYASTCFGMGVDADAEPIDLTAERPSTRRAAGSNTVGSVVSPPAAGGALDSPCHQRATARRASSSCVRGKYRAEVHSVVTHMRWLQCAGSRFVPWPRELLLRFGGKPLLAIAVPAGHRSLPLKATNRFIQPLLHQEPPERRARTGRRVGTGCPLRAAPQLPAAPVPLSGFCAQTYGGGDCATGDSGAWPLGRGEGMESCVRRCLGCERCNAVSYSRLGADCSWFHACHSSREVDELTSRLGCGWLEQGRCARNGSAEASRGQRVLADLAADPLAVRGEALLLVQTGWEWDYRTLRVRRQRRLRAFER